MDQCRAWMIRDDQDKYVHFNGLPPMLFDLQNDPHELVNLAADPAYQHIIYDYLVQMVEWRQTYEENSRGRWTEEKFQRSGISFSLSSWNFRQIRNRKG